MLFYFLAPVAIGVMSVLQNTLNKQISQQYGLALILLVNAAIILGAAGVLFLLAQTIPDRLGPFQAGVGAAFEWKWWYIFPGLFGFSVIFGIPTCMNKLGALTVFISFVTAQVVTSMVWDTWVDGLPLTVTKAVGATIALIGVILVAL
ncbi:MAG: DMT family transporter [Deltaproteobacteria bacterium]|nr:DMT family transporter [Deltaproteobacteria bacterium]